MGSPPRVSAPAACCVTASTPCGSRRSGLRRAMVRRGDATAPPLISAQAGIQPLLAGPPSNLGPRSRARAAAAQLSPQAGHDLLDRLDLLRRRLIEMADEPLQVARRAVGHVEPDAVSFAH